MTGKSVFIVAIDFGMSYSGCCSSLATATDQICQMYWGTEEGLRTPRTPMCVLFNQKFRKFRKFGSDAVMKYKSLPSRKADNRYFFRKFRMKL